MAKNKDKAICFVVVIKRNGLTFYLKREEAGEVNEKGQVLKESVGVFSPSLIEAIKFQNMAQAEISCSAYSGAVVEIIKTGEVLK